MTTWNLTPDTPTSTREPITSRDAYAATNLASFALAEGHPLTRVDLTRGVIKARAAAASAQHLATLLAVEPGPCHPQWPCWTGTWSGMRLELLGEGE